MHSVAPSMLCREIMRVGLIYLDIITYNRTEPVSKTRFEAANIPILRLLLYTVVRILLTGGASRCDEHAIPLPPPPPPVEKEKRQRQTEKSLPIAIALFLNSKKLILNYNVRL